jgi:hypothetical protein
VILHAEGEIVKQRSKKTFRLSLRPCSSFAVESRKISPNEVKNAHSQK